MRGFFACVAVLMVGYYCVWFPITVGLHAVGILDHTAALTSSQETERREAKFRQGPSDPSDAASVQAWLCNDAPREDWIDYSNC